MKKLETIKVNKEIEVDITCDICGESCRVGIPEGGELETESQKEHRHFEYLNMSTHWGWYSGKDLENWSAQVCEKCVDKHLAPLINFKKTNYL